MADSRGSSTASVISAPSGGGALRAIGEKFSPDLQTGTANLSVPLAVPPGRGGFDPSLALAYSSGAGNGPFGLGWSIGVSPISRRTGGGVPTYEDSADVFVLAGNEDLVPVPGATAPDQRYRLRTEGSFARITHRRTATDDWWEVRSTDGTTTRYGTPGRRGTDPAVIADPHERTRVFAWYPTLSRDALGNHIVYEYERDATRQDGAHHWDQLYLSRVRYVDYGPPSTPEYLVSVNFEHEPRPDEFSQYRAGFEIRTVRRCRSIAVRTHAGSDALVKTYHLAYGSDTGAEPLNGCSLLARIVVKGHDGAHSETLPPLEFRYGEFAPARRRFFPVAGEQLPFVSLAQPGTELVDLFGAGLPDILEMNGTVRFWRNLGRGRYDRPREMRDAPSVRLQDPGVQLIDANGDGCADLLVSTAEIAGYFPLQVGGGWDRRNFHRYRQAPSFDLKDPSVRLLDLDGDGVTDALRSGARFECFFNQPDAGWTSTSEVQRRASDVFPNVDLADPRVKVADMTGDGLQDIVLVHDRIVEYWPNLGHGRWGARITMHNAPRLPYRYLPERLLLGDVDGDGAADLIYVGDDEVTLWVNRSGNGWSEPIVIPGTPPMLAPATVRLTDLLGLGIGGVLWSGDAVDTAHTSLFFLDFAGARKPYLLEGVENNIGGSMAISYRSSSEDFIEDERHADTRWKTTLPFPVHVVGRVEVTDHFSGNRLTTEYRYHHGYWDGADHEFRGFARVDQRDTEFAAADAEASLGTAPPAAEGPSPALVFPTETRTWFHVGPIGARHGDWEELDLGEEYWRGDAPAFERPPTMIAWLRTLPRPARRDALRALRGRILRSELYVRDGGPRQDHPVTVTENLHGVAPLPIGAPWPGTPASWQFAVFFPHNLVQRTTHWHRGSDPLTQLQFVGEYDAYGAAGLQLTIAVPRGRDFRTSAPPGAPYLAIATRLTFAVRDDTTLLVRRRATITTRAVVNDGAPSADTLWASVQHGVGLGEILSQTRDYYDGDAFVGLPLGQLGDRGALVRTETLALTEAMLTEAYATGAVTSPPEAPPYLIHSAPPPWTADYPLEFRARTAALGGYTFHSGGPSPLDTRGYWVQSTRTQYDFHAAPPGVASRGLPTAHRDARGGTSFVRYDTYDYLPEESTDPAGLVTRAAYEYRVMRPSLITDPNGNRQHFTYTPLGHLEAVAILGKTGEAVADTVAEPGTRYTFDFAAFHDPARRQPISVRTTSRVHYATDASVPPNERNQVLEMVEYSDGFGRLLQTRASAAAVLYGVDAFGDAGLPADQSSGTAPALGHLAGPGAAPRVLVSGTQLYDNKGQPVVRYEPYFATGWAYAPAGLAERGQRVTIAYDALGRVFRTVYPDGSEQRVVFGVPFDVQEPDAAAPSPWEAYTYDANDNAGRTHPATSTGYATHWNTATSTERDALGRVVRVVERNGATPADWHTTSTEYDLRGNVISMTDALGRVAARFVYDLLAHPWRTESIDAGVRRTVVDALGTPIESRDARGALRLTAVDVNGRTTHLWARDNATETVTLRERLIFGDDPSGGPPATARAHNRLGRLYCHYDEAGVVTMEHYDHRGNPVESSRQTISDSVILSSWSPAPPLWAVRPFRVDWQPSPGQSLAAHAAAVLEPVIYRTSTTFDALRRIVRLQYPEAVDGTRRTLEPLYDEGGALTAISLDGVPYVREIAHSATGALLLCAYENGVITRYAYDPQTARCVRMRTEHATSAAPHSYIPSAAPIQDEAYTHDLAGNLLSVRHRVPGCGIPGTAAGLDDLLRRFTYDPRYRLSTATGRECDVPAPPAPWDDSFPCSDPTRTRAYTETIAVDALGNLVQRTHGAVQTFAVLPGTNRLTSLSVGGTTFHYSYDEAGNLVGENTDRRLEWDHADRLRAFRIQAGTGEPSVWAEYLYDALGQRVKKIVRKQGGRVESTVSIAGVFERHRLVSGGTEHTHDTIHITDQQRDVALVRVGAPFPGDSSPAVLFSLSDHLGSCTVILDAAGTVVSREEYTPYGTTSFGDATHKRFRFLGKERQEESGLYAIGVRAYAQWLGRWISCDPAGPADSLSLYVYARANPVTLADKSGAQTIPDIPVPKDCKGNRCHTSYPSAMPPPKLEDWFAAPGQGMEAAGDMAVGVAKFCKEIAIDALQGAALVEGSSIAGCHYGTAAPAIKETTDALEKLKPTPKNDAEFAGQHIIGPVLMAEAGGAAARVLDVEKATLPEIAAVDAEVAAAPKPAPAPTPKLPSPPPGKEVYIQQYLDDLMQSKVDESVREVLESPATAYRRVPPDIAVPASVESPLTYPYTGYAVEYGTRLRVRRNWFLDSVFKHVPKKEQVPGTGDFGLRPPFIEWRLKPYDVTTPAYALKKMGSGVRDYTYLTYTIDWASLRAFVRANVP